MNPKIIRPESSSDQDCLPPVLTALDWTTLDGLLRNHGDAAYLIDVDGFRKNFHNFQSAFAGLYPKLRLGYSYKTNYVPFLCLEANRLGAYAEVVSRFELDLAFKLGVSGDDIIFNGPLKTGDDLSVAAEAGATINIDNWQEIELLRHLAPRASRPVQLGIRCCFQLHEDHYSRFGFDLESGDFERAIRELDGIANCDVRGIHCHFSHHRDANSYRNRALRMVAIAKKYFPGGLRFIDIGGGFCGPMSEKLREQFSVPVPDFNEYARHVAPVFADAFPGLDPPELILEPGMGLVSGCMQFACRVVSTKKAIGRKYAVTTGSVYNIKPTLNNMNLPLHCLSGRSRSAAKPDPPDNLPTQIVGYTCMEIDLMYRDFADPVQVGDILVFENTGAYTVVLLPPFIRAAPAILGVHGDGSTFVIRRAQGLDDILGTYETDFSTGPNT